MPDNPRIEELRRRVQSDPASIAFAALAEEYRRAGQYEEAIDTCKAGLQRHPAYLSAHVTLGRALIEVNRFDEAREELEYVLKVAPENLAAIRGLAEIHHRKGEAPDEHHYQAAVDAAHGSTAPSATAAPVPVAPAPAAASRPAVQPVPVVPPPAGRPPDPSLPRLEAFLAAIVRARQEFDATDSAAR